MGRNHNQIVTWNDIDWMESNNMLFNPSGTGAPQTNRGASAGLLRSRYFLNENLLTGYPNNRLVPYQKIQQLPTLHSEVINKLNYAGDTTTVGLYNYWGYAWTISWKKYIYWEVPPYYGQYIEDTTGTWFTATPTSGTNAPNINLTVGYNDTPSSRYVVLTLTSENQTMELYIYQNANPGVETTKVVISSGTTLQNSCEMFAVGQNRFDYYVEEGYSWSGATKLYSNIEGTTLAPSGYYSNGQRARYWNKVNEEFAILGQYQIRSVACDTQTDPVDPDPVYENNMIILARYQTVNSAEYACTMFNNGLTQHYYIPNGRTWSNTPVLYTDIDGNNTANTGWYSNGVSARLWIKETGLFQSSASC